jgi:hypothetical protein
VLSDADNQHAGFDVAQIIEPEPPPPPEPPEAPRPEDPPATASTGSAVGMIVRDGELPGTYVPGVDGRTMPASDDPNATALKYAKSLYNEATATPVASGLEKNGGFVARLPDGAYITYRPAGLSGKATLSTTASVAAVADGPNEPTESVGQF